MWSSNLILWFSSCNFFTSLVKALSLLPPTYTTTSKVFNCTSSYERIRGYRSRRQNEMWNWTLLLCVLNTLNYSILATWVPLMHAPRKISISAWTLHISNSCDGVLAFEHTHHTLAIDVKQPNCNYDKNNPKHWMTMLFPFSVVHILTEIQVATSRSGSRQVW